MRKIKMQKQEILEKYPSLYREKDLPMEESCMYWGLDVPEDWLPVVDKLSGVLESMPKYSYKTDPDNESSYVQVKVAIIAKQVKQKFGDLRFYYTVELLGEDCPEDMSDDQVEGCYAWASQYARGAIAMATELCEGEPY
jgi:hypothetical protein